MNLVEISTIIHPMADMSEAAIGLWYLFQRLGSFDVNDKANQVKRFFKDRFSTSDFEKFLGRVGTFEKLLPVISEKSLNLIEQYVQSNFLPRFKRNQLTCSFCTSTKFTEHKKKAIHHCFSSGPKACSIVFQTCDGCQTEYHFSYISMKNMQRYFFDDVLSA